MSIYTEAADKLSSPEIACAAHATINELKQALYSPYMSWLLEEKVIHGGMRFLGMEETTNLLAVMGLVRGGINLPTAAAWITAVREQGIFAPVHIARIECRRNGRTFAFLNDHANDAAEAAGPVLFQVTIDFDGYRAAFREALAARQPAAARAAA